MNNVINLKKTILIVDDEEAFRRILKDTLEEKGYSTLEAVNGKDCIETALANHPNLILLDLFMPQMGGMEALRILREDSWGANVPVIILTNLNPNNEELVEGMAEYKPLFYLIKSDWKLQSVIEKINEILKGKDKNSVVTDEMPKAA